MSAGDDAQGQARQQIRDRLAGLSGTDPKDWFLLSKARHALLTVLRTLPAGEVVTQPLTCVTAVVPVLAAGHRPHYVDLDPDTLALDPGALPAVVDGATRAVVAQHTFGAAAPVAQVRARLPEQVLVVEDSAHCLGEVDRSAHVSVHSFGVEKMLPTRAGAAVWVNPEGRGMPWHTALVGALAALGQGGARQAFAHRAGNPLRRITGRLGRPGARLLDLAASAGLADLAILPAEREGGVAGEPTLLSGPALTDVARELPALEASRRHRRRIAAVYRDGLAGLPGVTTPAVLDREELTLVRYPILLGSTREAEATFEALRSQGLVPGRWYRPLLFPGPADSDLAAFGYRAGSCPVAEDVSARILNLPTAPFVTEDAARRGVAVVAGE